MEGGGGNGVDLKKKTEVMSLIFFMTPPWLYMDIAKMH